LLGRRGFLLGSLGAVAACSGRSLASPEKGLEMLRARLGGGGRLGVAALDGGTGGRIGLDANGRYAMCSTFKLPLAAAILAESDRGALSLADEIPFGAADLLDHAPVTRPSLPAGRLSVERLCAAIIEVGDNAAANLLLGRIGGPAALTAFMRRCGDIASRLDRIEPALNSNLPGDLRDTTTPAAMLGLMDAILIRDVLRRESRQLLLSWMRNATTGRARLRAGLPAGWTVGDKTGTGANGANCDIAIASPPGRPPILIASYQSGGDAPAEVRDTVHAGVAKIVAESFA
jgi:beta-lactamase class A